MRLPRFLGVFPRRAAPVFDDPRPIPWAGGMIPASERNRRRNRRALGSPMEYTEEFFARVRREVRCYEHSRRVYLAAANRSSRESDVGWARDVFEADERRLAGLLRALGRGVRIGRRVYEEWGVTVDVTEYPERSPGRQAEEDASLGCLDVTSPGPESQGEVSGG